MEKRYQVFLSSTYSDLLEERAEVMQALLELDCMPSGMELFPAANEDQWNWIKKVIDESDYYIVIVGGRYGTISGKTGLSYTEMEYRYATETNKPVIAFLHENPSDISAGKTESTPSSIKKLNNFRELVQKRLCKFYSNPSDLGAKVSRSITQLIKQSPAIGWVRASHLPEDTAQEILNLKKQIDKLQEKLLKAGLEEPTGIDNLSKGEDQFSLKYTFETKFPRIGKNKNHYWVKGEVGQEFFKTNWDEIFKAVAPEIIVPQKENVIKAKIKKLIESKITTDIDKFFPGHKLDSISMPQEEFDTIKIQLRALRLISISQDENEYNRSDYWLLTPYGDNYMTKLIAINKA